MSFKSILAVLSGIALVFIGVACVDEGGISECHPTVAKATAGDTISSLVQKYCTGGDLGATIDEVIHLNGGTNIQVGQGVILPG